MPATDSNNATPHKRCLGCGYILDGLPENRCPECGREFDPDDHATFTAEPVFGLHLLMLSLAGLLGVCVGLGTLVSFARIDWPELPVFLIACVPFGWLACGVSLSGCVRAFRPGTEVRHRQAVWPALIISLIVLASLFVLLALAVCMAILSW